MYIENQQEAQLAVEIARDIDKETWITKGDIVGKYTNNVGAFPEHTQNQLEWERECVTQITELREENEINSLPY